MAISTIEGPRFVIERSRVHIPLLAGQAWFGFDDFYTTFGPLKESEGMMIRKGQIPKPSQKR